MENILIFIKSVIAYFKLAEKKAIRMLNPLEVISLSSKTIYIINHPGIFKSFRFPLIILLLLVHLQGNSQTCMSQISSFPYQENFESGFGLWTQATDDHFELTRQSGVTPNAGTGPSEAAEGSFYLYANSGLYSPWKNSGLISPCIDLSNQGGGILSFSYHMKGSSMGWLELFASTNNGANWTKIWGAGGTEYGDKWIQHQLDISSYSGQRVKFKFLVTMNSQPGGDIGLDEFSVTSIAKYQTPSLSNSENYVFTRIYQAPYSTNTNIKANRDVIEQVTYLDGLGRPKQQVSLKASPINQKDIVTHIEYDQFGREAKSWLPYYEPNGNTGSYRGDISLNTRQYYLNKFPDDFDLINVQDVNSYSESYFDSSPLNRVNKQGAPGKAWELNPNSNNDHTVKFSYETNQNQEVRLYRVTLDSDFTPTLINLSSNEFYPAGQLFKFITRDENWTTGKNHTIEEFKDKQGRVLLKRNYADIDLNGDGDTNVLGEKEVPHDTYYIYDDYGNLTFVLPPKAEPTETNVALSIENLNNLCYQYKYDKRNRSIEKRIPGKNKEYIIYNNLDRPIMTQDGNQRAKSPKEWLFTKYDAFGRVTFTGIVKDNRDRSIIQAEADSYTGTHWNERGPQNTLAGTMIYYTNQGYPNTTITEILTLNYYDNYNFPAVLDGISMDTQSWGVPLASNVKGLLTYTQSKVLETSFYVRTAIQYDVKGRQTWSRSNNDYLGTHYFSALKLDFTGKVTESYNSHSKNGGTPLVYIDYFTYDHRGRLKKQVQALKDYGFPLEVIAENHYDELGQLIGKGVGNLQGKNRLQNILYQYNVRGWLKGINDLTNLGDNLFGFEISYNNPKIGAEALYNGNISETHWNTKSVNTTGNLVSNNYKYGYDALNRITGALDNTGNYNLGNVIYDKMGNILSLQRHGQLNANATLFGNMDQLTYGYEANSNKLLTVNDAGSGTLGFKNGSTALVQYNYDFNGNLTSDANKGIPANGISYNHLNLPTSITLPGGTISYTYDATGTKLRKLAGSTTSDYANGFIYENNNLKQFSHPEGYVEPDGLGGFDYAYQYKDHVGNVRLSYSDLNGNGSIDPSSEILQEQNYYPFGLEHKGYNNVVNGSENNYFNFNGKELEEDLNLGWMDYGKRRYMRDIGRWTSVDPLADVMPDQSPFNFSFNSPLMFIDPDGALPWPIHIRSFISTSSVGGGTFRGDGRGPSTQTLSQGAWSRVSSSFVVDPAKGSVTSPVSQSDLTIFYGTGLGGLPPMAERSNPSSSISNVTTYDTEGAISLDFAHSAKDPITPSLVTPDLDVQASLDIVETLGENGGMLSVTGTFSGDAFPSTEAFITDQSGKTNLLLGAHKEQGGLTNLFGENKRPTFTVNMMVNIDKNGNFTGVTQGNKTYTVKEWNKHVQDTFNK